MHTLSHCSKGEGVSKHWNAAKQEELKETMGNWLGELAPWDAFVTWTFDRIVTANGAMFWAKRHLKWLEKAAEQPVYGFVGAEKGKGGGLIHLHGLLGNVKHMNFFCENRLLRGQFGQSAALSMPGPADTHVCFLTIPNWVPNTTSRSTSQKI
jgi:hypothetical protein